MSPIFKLTFLQAERKEDKEGKEKAVKEAKARALRVALLPIRDSPSTSVVQRLPLPVEHLVAISQFWTSLALTVRACSFTPLGRC